MLSRLFGLNDPGKLGSLDPYDNARNRSVSGAVITGLLALTALLGPFFLTAEWLVTDPDLNSAKLLFLEGVYVLIGYRIRFSPAYDNIFLPLRPIESELRWSDDWNWALVVATILFFPGRLVGIGLVDFVRLFAPRTESKDESETQKRKRPEVRFPGADD